MDIEEIHSASRDNESPWLHEPRLSCGILLGTCGGVRNESLDLAVEVPEGLIVATAKAPGSLPGCLPRAIGFLIRSLAVAPVGLDSRIVRRCCCRLWLPPALRAAWEQRFPPLAELSRLAAAG